jgi:phage virion morphogenesis protein
MISVSLNDSIFQNKINSLLSTISGKDRRIIFKKVGMAAKEGVTENFKYQGIKPDKWIKNKESALKRKGAHKRILQDSGLLNSSISYEVVEDGALVGTNAQSEKGFNYPEVQQFGTKDKKIPARPWLGLDDKAKNDIENVVKNEIERVLNG